MSLLLLSKLNNQIQAAQQTRSSKDPQPKGDISHKSSPAQQASTTQRDEWQLHHLEEEQIPPQPTKDAQHDQLMHTGRQQKSHQACRHAREVE